MDQVKPAPSTTPRFTTKSTVKPTSHVPTVPVPAAPLLPNNLKCTANTLDTRYGRTVVYISYGALLKTLTPLVHHYRW